MLILEKGCLQVLGVRKPSGQGQAYLGNLGFIMDYGMGQDWDSNQV